MSLRKFCYLLFFVLIQYSAVSQDLTQTVRGVVQDRDSKIPLPGANVVILDTEKLLGASTDPDGAFKIENVPIGRHSLKVSFLGYETKVIPNIEVTSGKENYLVIELAENITEMEGVVITSDEVRGEPVNEMSLISTRPFSLEETKRYAGSFYDPSRMASSFAGVVGGGDNDVENEIVIRGNSPRGLLWQLEGVEVPSLNHFTDQGASSGSISILSSNVLGNSDFYTGAFPAEYGNAISGVFDIQLRKGNNAKREYALRIGVTGVDASMEGPLSANSSASYLANYRYSTLSILNKVGINLLDDAIPVFQDLSFNIYLPTKKQGYFSVFGVGGLSEIEETDNGLLPDNTFGVISKDDLESNMGVVGLKHQYFFNDKAFIKSVFSYSAQEVISREERINRENIFYTEQNEEFVNEAARADIMLNYKLNAKHVFQTGMVFSHLSYDLFSERFDYEQQGLATLVDENDATSTFQAFTSWKYRLNEKLTFIGGAHLMYFNLTNKASLEPRLSTKWQFSPKQSLSAGFGIHSRREALATYLVKIPSSNGGFTQPNLNLDFTKARHYIIGYDNLVTKDLRFQIEAYYQDLYNVPVVRGSFSSALNVSDGFASSPLINDGTGENYGLEVTLEKFFSRNYFFLTNLSLYESKYVGGDGIERNTLFNGNWISNVLVGKEFTVKKNNLILLSFRSVFAGGKRFVPIDENGQPVVERAFEDKTDPYFRTDIQASYTINKNAYSMEFRIDIQNVFDRANIWNVTYSPSEERLVEVKRGQFLPILSFQVKF